MISHHLSMSSSSNHSTVMYTGDPNLGHSEVLFGSRMLPSSHPGTSACYFLGSPPLPTMRPPFLVHHTLLIFRFPWPPHVCFVRRNAQTWRVWDLVNVKTASVYLYAGWTVLRWRLWLANHLPSEGWRHTLESLPLTLLGNSVHVCSSLCYFSLPLWSSQGRD